MFTALAALTALAILLQAVLAGQFVDRTGRGGWINAHAINADVVLALALLTAAYSMATMRRSARELAIGSAVLAVLVIIQLAIGHAITHQNDDGLLAIHVPLAMAIFGLSVWLNVRPARQRQQTACSKPTLWANDRAH
jgi:hypothetical protein